MIEISISITKVVGGYIVINFDGTYVFTTLNEVMFFVQTNIDKDLKVN